MGDQDLADNIKHLAEQLAHVANTAEGRGISVDLKFDSLLRCTPSGKSDVVWRSDVTVRRNL